MTLASALCAMALLAGHVPATGETIMSFHKYVVGKDGQVRAAFASAVTPDSKELKNAIEEALRSEVY